MRIGIDVRPLLDGALSGVGEYTLRIVQAMLEQPSEHHFVLFTNRFSTPPPLPNSWPRDRYTLRAFRFPNRLVHGMFLLTGLPRMRSIAPDIDVLLIPNHHFVPSLKGVPYVMTVHDLSYVHYPTMFSRRKRVWHRIIRPVTLMKNAAALIAVSRSTEQDIHRTFPSLTTPVHVVHSGVIVPVLSSETIQDVRTRLHLPDHFLFSLSTLEPRKNLLTLLDAFARLKDSGAYSGSLVIAGQRGWSTAAFDTALRTHRYKKDIVLTSYVSAEEKFALYRLADLFLYLSVYEGFGFPPLEAALSGTPVIAGHHSSVSEVMGGGALLVDVYNTYDVVHAAQALLTQPNIRVALQQQSAQLQERYRWDRAAEQTLDVLEEAAHNNPTRL